MEKQEKLIKEDGCCHEHDHECECDGNHECHQDEHECNCHHKNHDHQEHDCDSHGDCNCQDEKKLMQLRIHELETELETTKNDYFKVYADMENLRKRLIQDQETKIKYALQSTIEDILPVLDNFERAITACKSNEAISAYVQGFEMTYSGLLNVLKEKGVSVIEAEGKEFDPNFHQAIQQVKDENFTSNMIVKVLQNGYLLHGRVIRPTLVIVNE